MPRTALPVTTLTRAGVAPAETDGNPGGGNGHAAAWGQGLFLVVRNADGSNPHTVTLQIARTIDGQAVSPRTVQIPAAERRFIGPFPGGDYRQEDGTVHIDVDSSQLKLIALQL